MFHDTTQRQFHIQLAEILNKQWNIIENVRHLVLATTQQIEVLKKVKAWYKDATFKIVSEPFYQLFYINAFMNGGHPFETGSPVFLF